MGSVAAEDLEKEALGPPVSPFSKVASHHNATEIDMLRAPYGLPMKITAEQYRANPICQLSAYNYKVNAKVGSTRATQRYLLAVLDTGAGPNLIREGCCPRDALESLDDSREIVNLSSATNHRLDVLGITTLTVTLGDYTARVPFVVVRNLGADILLGCTFIDRHVEGIFPTKRNARLANGCVIPIIRRRALEPVVEQLPEKKILGKRSLSGFNAIRLTEPITIPPHAQTYARVTVQSSRVAISRNETRVMGQKEGSCSQWCLQGQAERSIFSTNCKLLQQSCATFRE